MDDKQLSPILDKKGTQLLSNRQVVEAHYGYRAVNIYAGKVTQVYVILQLLRDGQPKEMDGLEILILCITCNLLTKLIRVRWKKK